MSESQEIWTVEKLLKWSKKFFGDRGLDSPRLDAELLLAHVLGVDRIRLYMDFDRPLMPEELVQYRAVVKRRAQREPVAYITGTRAFWSIDIKCDPRALIPRPDTEVVLEAALARVPDDQPCRLLDVGTGTGALALAFLTERDNSSAVLLDISADALALAQENAEALDLMTRAEFVESNLLEEINESFDLIISNPPYVGESERDLMDVDVLEFEPPIALFSGDAGLTLIQTLVPQAFEHLRPGGWFVMEFGFTQGEAVRQILCSAGFSSVKVIQDYGGHDRVGVGQRYA